MAQPPKTPAPPRRKPAARKSTRSTPARAAAPKKESNAASPSGETKPATAPKPTTRRQTGGTSGKSAGATKSVASRAKTAKSSVSKVASDTVKAVTDSAPAQFVGDTRERMGDRNFFAALIGGVAAIGAAVTGVLLALRDGNPDGPADKNNKKR